MSIKLKDSAKLPIEIDIFILSVLATVHSFFTVAIFIFIAITSLGIDVPFLNWLMILAVCSFLVFRRCVATDLYNFMYNHIQNYTCSDSTLLYSGHDLSEESLPFFAKDNYIRKCIQRLMTGESVNSSERKIQKSLRALRLDILKNIDPLLNCKDIKSLQKMHNHRLHYIILNIVLILMLIYKFNAVKLIPLLLVWVFSVFSL